MNPSFMESYDKSHVDNFFKSKMKKMFGDTNVFKFSKYHLDFYIKMMKNKDSTSICKKLKKILGPEDVVYLEKTNKVYTTIKKSEEIFLPPSARMGNGEKNRKGQAPSRNPKLDCRRIQRRTGSGG